MRPVCTLSTDPPKISWSPRLQRSTTRIHSSASFHHCSARLWVSSTLRPVPQASTSVMLERAGMNGGRAATAFVVSYQSVTVWGAHAAQSLQSFQGRGRKRAYIEPVDAKAPHIMAIIRALRNREVLFHTRRHVRRTNHMVGEP